MTSTPTRPLPPWPHHDEDERAAVDAVLASGRVNYWTGTEGRAFEQEFARYTKTAHALTVANGTVALELALEAFGIGQGDEVIVPARTFIATASAVVRVGATPVVSDVTRESQCLDPASVEACLSEKTKAIIAVHLAGWPADMAALKGIADDNDLVLIEDCAQAHGAKLHGQPVGSIGHAGCFSFCQDKIMTTGGEGGIVTMNDDHAFERAWSLRDHGKNRIRTLSADHPSGFRYLVDHFGTNWRMTEMQAAIGRVQLTKLDGWIKRRQRNAHALTEHLRTIPGLSVATPESARHHAYYKHYSLVETDQLRAGWTRDRIVDALQAKGIPAQAGACPDISREAAFDALDGFRHVDKPNAEWLAPRTLMLPVHPTLTLDDLAFMGSGLRTVMTDALDPSAAV